MPFNSKSSTPTDFVRALGSGRGVWGLIVGIFAGSSFVSLDFVGFYLFFAVLLLELEFSRPLAMECDIRYR